MIKSKLLVGLLLVALAVLFAPASHAQACPAPNATVKCPLVAIGSSAVFPSIGIAAVSGDPVTHIGPLCGTRMWTGTGKAKDARFAAPEESASIWVAWDNDTAPTIVCEYLAVDSIEGQRLFFGQGAVSGQNATLDLAPSNCATTGTRGNKVSFVWDQANFLPFAVWNALMGGSATDQTCTSQTTNPAHFNVAFTDVRAEDAKWLGDSRVLCANAFNPPFPPNDTKSCLGYGPGPLPGPAITSSYSTAISNNAAYNISGNDPVNTNVAVPAFQQIDIGEQAMMIIVNTIDTASSAGFGTLTAPLANPRLTNANSHELSGFYTGQLFFTRDLLGGNPSLALPQEVVHTLQREPMSGTYTTFEWQVVRQSDGRNDESQETGICAPASTCYANNCFAQVANSFPNAPCSNPVSYAVAGVNAVKSRVIGTGQMVATADNCQWFDRSTPPNQIPGPSVLGYAFWSLGTFGAKPCIKYLTLDGVDPLVASYSVNDGNFPGLVVGQGAVANTPAPVGAECGGYFNGGGGVTQFSCAAGYTLPTFDGIQNGNYRNWNYVRAVYYGSSPLAPSFNPINITGFILAAQDQTAPVLPLAGRVTDFFPATYCTASNGITCTAFASPANVFRSHYSPGGGIVPNNGVNTVVPGPESGGDVGGAVFNIQAELDTGLPFSGNTFLIYIQ